MRRDDLHGQRGREGATANEIAVMRVVYDQHSASNSADN